MLNRGSKKAEKLREKLMSVGGGAGGEDDSASGTGKDKSGLQKALETRDRLVHFDRTSAQRSKVIDDESDYFGSDSNR